MIHMEKINMEGRYIRTHGKELHAKEDAYGGDTLHIEEPYRVRGTSHETMKGMWGCTLYIADNVIVMVAMMMTASTQARASCLGPNLYINRDKIPKLLRKNLSLS